VEQTGTDATRVQNEINRRMAAALEKAKAAAGDGRQLRVESGGYWIYQERPQEAPARWRGAQQLSLVGTNTATLLPLAAQLQQDGFLMSGVNWELSNEARRKLEDELTTEAIERLHARSRFVAAAMDAQIVRFDKISIGTAGDRPAMLQRGPMPMGAAAAGAAAAPIAAEPGLETVQIGVQAEILVKQRP
jgi:predicted secreted protein